MAQRGNAYLGKYVHRVRHGFPRGVYAPVGTWERIRTVSLAEQHLKPIGCDDNLNNNDTC
jgi:hypothetical protein